MSKGKIILRRTLKVLVYLLLSLAVIIISFWIFINSDYGKNYIRKQAQQYLQKKINTKVTIGKLNYDLPNEIELGNIYIEDKNKDTLLFAGSIDVKIKMLDLLDGQVNVSKILLSDNYADVYSSKDNVEFNYQFIIDAFADKENNSNSTNTNDSSSLAINIKHIQLKNIRANYKDVFGGTEMMASIGLPF